MPRVGIKEMTPPAGPKLRHGICLGKGDCAAKLGRKGTKIGQAQDHKRQAAQPHKNEPPLGQLPFLPILPNAQRQNNRSTQAQICSYWRVEENSQEQGTPERGLTLREQGPHAEQENRGGKGARQTGVQEA